MRFLTALVLAFATTAFASSAYPPGMGNWMRPTIEGLVNDTAFERHHVLFGNYDEHASRWSELNFQDGDGREPVAEVFITSNAVHRWEAIKVRSIDPRDAYYTAGFAEALLTHENMFNLWANGIAAGAAKIQKSAFGRSIIAGQKQAARSYPTTTPAGQQLANLLRQVDGLADGWQAAYEAAGSPADMANFTADDVFMMSYFEDAETIGDAVKALAGDLSASNRPTHCTALHRIIDGELHFGHASLNPYVFTTRQFKSYEFPEGRNVTMSGYPGMIFSADDFLISGHGVQLMSTSLLNFNNSNLLTIDSHNVPGFLALMVASYLATSAKEWVDLFVPFNSGTYNAAITATDLNKARVAHKTGSALLPETMILVEVVPHLTQVGDLSAALQSKGYWLNFDVAYFPATVAMTNSSNPANMFGITIYNTSALVASTRRDMPYMVNMTTLFYGMRHNNFPHDPAQLAPACTSPLAHMDCKYIPGNLSTLNVLNTSPEAGPGARYDLNVAIPPTAEGGVDAKVMSVSMALDQRSMILQNGPTFVQQPKFNFTEYFALHPPAGGVPKLRGLPEVFDFPPVLLSANSPVRRQEGAAGATPARSTVGVAIGLVVVMVAVVAAAAVVVVRRRRSAAMHRGETSQLL